MTTTEQTLDFAGICRIEPRIQTILRSLPSRAKQYRSKGHDFWWLWLHVKRELSLLVGWDAAKPQLISSHCYDIVYSALFNELNKLWPEENLE
jgi:hypothetical protein